MTLAILPDNIASFSRGDSPRGKTDPTLTIWPSRLPKLPSQALVTLSARQIATRWQYQVIGTAANDAYRRA